MVLDFKNTHTAKHFTRTSLLSHLTLCVLQYCFARIHRNILRHFFNPKQQFTKHASLLCETLRTNNVCFLTHIKHLHFEFVDMYLYIRMLTLNGLTQYILYLI